MKEADLFELAQVAEGFMKDKGYEDCGILFMVVTEKMQSYMSTMSKNMSVRIMRDQADRLDAGCGTEIELLSMSKPKDGVDPVN